MKKKICTSQNKNYFGLSKLLKTMKLTVFLLLITVSGIFANNSYSQSKRLDLNMQEATVKEVLGNIEKQSEFSFLYSENLVDVERKIDVSFKKIKIDQALKLIFKGTEVDFSIRDRIIVLTTPEELILDSEELQQQKTITGIVTDVDGLPLPGVTVIIKGTMEGTTTDMDGKYSISNVPENSTLQFSFIGMLSKEVLVGTQTTINITMIFDTIGIEEVVAIGYGIQRREDLTSSVTNIKPEDFNKGAIKSVGQLIQGKASGLSIVNSSGDPNGNLEIQIRGVLTLAGSTTPLVVIDGIPSSNANTALKLLSPEDVESIDVLKDGSAAAIYGTRGSNGVIIITTKKAKKTDDVKISVHSYMSSETIKDKVEMLSAEEYRTLINELDGQFGWNAVDIDQGASTDWVDEISRTGLSNSHYMSVQKGGDNSSIAASVNYKTHDGIMINSGRESLRARLNYLQEAIDGKLKFEFNMMHQTVKMDKFSSGAYNQALKRNPTAPVYDTDGNYQEEPGTWDYLNPVSMLKERVNNTQEGSTVVSGKLSLKPIEGLTLSAMGSMDRLSSMDGYASTFKHYDTWANQNQGYASRGSYLRKNKNLELLSEYKGNVGVHFFTILGGYNYFETGSEGFWANNTRFPTDVFGYNDLSIGEGLSQNFAGMDSYKGETKNISFFGRLNYNFNDKYLLSASMRREGSTKFGKDNKWGNFPAVSLGWKVHNEPFFNSSIINTFKVRAGYGITGSEPGASYLSLLLYQYDGTGNMFYYNGEYHQTLSPVLAPNPDLGWEKKAETNIGLDVSLFSDRVSLVVDYYNRKTSDLLWDYAVPSPPNISGSIKANVGEILNSGLEFTINAVPVETSDLTWNLGFNFASNRNEVKSLSNDLYELANDYINVGFGGGAIGAYTHRVEIGGPVGNFYGYVVDGLDVDGNWIYKDLVEDGEINELDKEVIGNALPKINIGLSSSLKWKSLDLMVSMRGAFGFQILNFPRMHYQPVMNLPLNVVKQSLEKPFGGDVYVTQTAEYNDYYIEDGDYLKIDNIEIGYTISTKTNYIKSFRIYASGNNLHTFTKYSGIDPEVPINGLTPGYDYYAKYPTTRSFVLGVNINF